MTLSGFACYSGSTIDAFDLESGEQIYSTIVHLTGVYQVVASSEAVTETPILATCSHDGSLRIVEMQTGKVISRLRSSVPGPCRGVSIVDAAQPFLVAACGNQIWIWNMLNMIPLDPLRGHHSNITCITTYRGNFEYSDETYPAVIVSADESGVLKLWHLEVPFPLLLRIQAHDGVIYCIKIIVIESSPHKHRILSGGLDRKIRMWNMITGELLHTFEEHIGPICSMSVLNFSGVKGAGQIHTFPRFQENVAVSKPKTVEEEIFQRYNSKKVVEKWHEPVLVSCGLDKKLIFWRLLDCSILHSCDLDTPAKGVSCTAFPRPMLVYTAGDNGLVILDLSLCPDDYPPDLKILISENVVDHAAKNVSESTNDK
jgi:hypothetical protein